MLLNWNDKGVEVLTRTQIEEHLQSEHYRVHPSRSRRKQLLGAPDGLVGELGDAALDGLGVEETHGFLIAGLAEEALAGPEHDREVFSRSSSTRSCSISVRTSWKLAGTTISPLSSCFSFETWRQSGTNVKGTIKISAPASSFVIRGTVVNGTIRFGTVGSLAITYSGTVSGSSMSGSYQIGGSTGGPWSASRAS